MAWSEETRALRAVLLGWLLLSVAGTHAAGADLHEDLQVELRSHSIEVQGERAAVTCVAVIQNVTAVACQYRFFLVGRDADGRPLFTGDGGSLPLERFEKVEVEISASVEAAAAKGAVAVDVMTESQCVVAYGETGIGSAARASNVKTAVKRIQSEQETLWEKRYRLYQAQELARARGDGEAAGRLGKEIAEVEEQIRENDRHRVRLRH